MRGGGGGGSYIGLDKVNYALIFTKDSILVLVYLLPLRVTKIPVNILRFLISQCIYLRLKNSIKSHNSNINGTSSLPVVMLYKFLMIISAFKRILLQYRKNSLQQQRMAVKQHQLARMKFQNPTSLLSSSSFKYHHNSK